MHKKPWNDQSIYLCIEEFIVCFFVCAANHFISVGMTLFHRTLELILFKLYCMSAQNANEMSQLPVIPASFSRRLEILDYLALGSSAGNPEWWGLCARFYCISLPLCCQSLSTHSSSSFSSHLRISLHSLCTQKHTLFLTITQADSTSPYV